MPGRCVYGVFLDQKGGVIDDAIVYQCTVNDYMIVVNASMGVDRLPRTCGRNRDGQPGAVINDHTDKVGKMDLQDRRWPGFSPEFSKIRLRFPRKWSTSPSRVRSIRSSCPPNRVTLLARRCWCRAPAIPVNSASSCLSPPNTSTPCGTCCWQRDNRRAFSPAAWQRATLLRAGAGLPLSHQDIGPWLFACNPWLFVLPWNEEGAAFTKDFTGAPALLAATNPPCTVAYTGFDPRKITINDQSRVTDLEGKVLGTILTCTTDMAIDRVGTAIISVATPVETGRPEPFTPRGSLLRPGPC